MKRRVRRTVPATPRSERDCAVLLRVGEALSGAQDEPAAARAIAAVAVPELCDWCFVDQIEETNVRRLATLHTDPALVERAIGIGERFPLDPEARFGPGTEAKRQLATLSRREREVLELVAAGLSTRDIATRLELGPRTVETHRVHVLRKLRLKGAVDVVRFAARCGLIADPASAGSRM